MTSQELMTLVQDNIPVKIALLDNKKLGMIRQWQELVYAGNYHSSHLLGPDWTKLAEAYGSRRSGLPRPTRWTPRLPRPGPWTARRWFISRSPRSRTSSR